jgi:ABC-2 type transport system ATP-binding protein
MISDLHARPDAGIALRSLTKTFRSPAGPVRAVRGVDLDIAPGETVALLGPNGAGKSTTIDMMLGLLPPDEGTVRIFGMTPREAVERGAIGAMLQSGQVVRDLSVRELVDMMASLYPNPLPVDEVLRLTGLTEIAKRRTHRLSGGQSQRVRAAVALVSNPDLLVLDEPTVAMDVEGRRDFWATMRRFASSGRTVVFATHYLEEADTYADRIVLLARGRVVADGPANELKAMVGLRTIRATLPRADLAALRALPGVSEADQLGESVVLRCSDSDAALRALLPAYPAARDVEVSSAGLEQAFLQLTGDDELSAEIDDVLTEATR